MATIAAGDIHGNSPALDDLLSCLRARIDKDDTVVCLGDYIDRGPELLLPRSRSATTSH
jgi:predicted phosphodiesterase